LSDIFFENYLSKRRLFFEKDLAIERAHHASRLLSRRVAVLNPAVAPPLKSRCSLGLFLMFPEIRIGHCGNPTLGHREEMVVERPRKKKNRYLNCMLSKSRLHGPISLLSVINSDQL